MEDDVYGPVLPPGLKTEETNETKKDSSSNATHGNSIIGPVLPPGMKQQSSQERELDDTRTKDDFNELSSHRDDRCTEPSLPGSGNTCDKTQTGKSPHCGPALPAQLKQEHFTSHFKTCQDVTSDDEEPENVIGPLPSEMAPASVSSAIDEFEKRAQKMKEILTEKPTDSGEPARESWMTELPSQLGNNIGLSMQTRTFRKRVIPDSERDTSGWTDTPADRERKAKDKEKRWLTSEKRQHSSREVVKAEKEIKKHKKSKHPESLLEMHQKQRKKKKKEKHKEKEKPKVRRPFDRDTDLQVNRFDDAKRKAIIERSRELNTRFSHAGSTSSFL